MLPCGSFGCLMGWAPKAFCLLCLVRAAHVFWVHSLWIVELLVVGAGSAARCGLVSGRLDCQCRQMWLADAICMGVLAFVVKAAPRVMPRAAACHARACVACRGVCQGRAGMAAAIAAGAHSATLVPNANLPEPGPSVPPTGGTCGCWIGVG